MGNTKEPMSQSRTAEVLLWLMQRSRYLHQMIHLNSLRRMSHWLAVAGSLSLACEMTCEMAFSVPPCPLMELCWLPETQAELPVLCCPGRQQKPKGTSHHSFLVTALRSLPMLCFPS